MSPASSRLERFKPATSAVLAVCLWFGGASACSAIGVWAGVGGTALLLGAWTLAAHRKAIAPLFHLRPAALLLGAAAGALMTAATYLLYPPIAGLCPSLTAATAELYRLFNSGPAAVRLMMLPAVIVAEEIVWRGLVQSTAETRFSRTSAILIAAMLYAAAHLPAGPPLLAAVALCCGLYWGALRAASGGLWAPVIAHLVWDAVVMAALPLPH